MGEISRRSLLLLGGGAFAVALVPVLRGRRARIFRRTLPVMGTIAEVAIVHADARAAEAALDAALGELLLVDRTMSRFLSESDVGRLNAAAGGGEAVEIGEDTAFVLAEALRFAEASGGAFDPCLGSATALWDVAHRRVPPEGAAFARLAGRRLHRALEVDRRPGRAFARLAERDAAVDLGGIAKGYAVDRAVEALRRLGVERGFVNAGGDLYAMGESEEGDPWRVGVQSASDPSTVERTLLVSNEAVATSGDYLQCFEHGGRRYHHILDPSTAAPRRTERHSITIVARRCLVADAAATALFGGGEAPPWAAREGVRVA